MAIKYGVFLARMQPVHNAHLFMVRKALDECDKVLIVLGSENKVDMLRNPYDITLREKMLRECLNEKDNERVTIITLPDWSMESDVESSKRIAYGRNGIGRHWMLCFSDSYTVETWKDGKCNTYDIVVSKGDSPFKILKHTTNKKSGHGTRISAFVLRHLPDAAAMTDILCIMIPIVIFIKNNKTLQKMPTVLAKVP